MRVRYLPGSRKVKPWVRPWMVHTVGWMIVFPIEVLSGLRLTIKGAAEETREQIAEFGFDNTP